MGNSAFDSFVEATIDALYFTDTGDVDQPPVDAELSAGARKTLERDCRDFWQKVGDTIMSEECDHVCVSSRAEDAGHDFWLTRNQHGSGFWDGDWDARYASLLTEVSEQFGECTTYLGDDGKIHIL